MQNQLYSISEYILPVDLLFQTPPIPWYSLLTSRALWSLVGMNFFHGWAFNTGLSQLAQYMKDVLQVNITKVQRL
jgi:hypothetical protein